MKYQTNEYFNSYWGNHNFNLPPISLQKKYYYYQLYECDQLACMKVTDLNLMYICFCWNFICLKLRKLGQNSYKIDPSCLFRKFVSHIFHFCFYEVGWSRIP